MRLSLAGPQDVGDIVGLLQANEAINGGSLTGHFDRPAVMETTALGAAYLAGSAAGLCPDLPGFAADEASRAVLRDRLAGWAQSGEAPYPVASNARGGGAPGQAGGTS